MKAIQTKYYPATDTKGARVKVWASDNKGKFAGYDYGASLADQCEDIATRYAEGLGWLGNGQYVLASGSLQDGHYCHVLRFTGFGDD